MYVHTAIVELGVSGAHSHTQPLERVFGWKLLILVHILAHSHWKRRAPVHSHWRQCFECFHMDSSTKSLLGGKEEKSLVFGSRGSISGVYV